MSIRGGGLNLQELFSRFQRRNPGQGSTAGFQCSDCPDLVHRGHQHRQLTPAWTGLNRALANKQPILTESRLPHFRLHHSSPIPCEPPEDQEHTSQTAPQGGPGDPKMAAHCRKGPSVKRLGKLGSRENNTAEMSSSPCQISPAMILGICRPKRGQNPRFDSGSSVEHPRAEMSLRVTSPRDPKAAAPRNPMAPPNHAEQISAASDSSSPPMGGQQHLTRFERLSLIHI